jgi:hypothetical protein
MSETDNSITSSNHKICVILSTSTQTTYLTGNSIVLY